jgi:Superfamily I DNA and RNA helicases
LFKINLTYKAAKQLTLLAKNNKRIYEDSLNTLEHIANGHWSGGTRVKKLQGISDVYEARLNSGDRMLFTLKQDEACIHYVYLVHDEVNRVARNSMLLTTHLETLNPHSIESYEIPKQEILKIYTSYPVDKSFVIETDDLIRLSLTEDLSTLSLRLKLVESQEEALRESLPLLLSGGAGSGKTTVSIYKLLQEAEQLLAQQEEVRLLYLSDNSRLIEDAKEQFQYLIHKRDFEEKLLESVHFWSFKDIIRLTPLDKFEQMFSMEAFFAEFNLYAQGNRAVRKLDPLLVYEELTAVIGAFMMPKQRYMTKEQYLSLPEFEAPDLSKDRLIVWSIHEWYVQLKQTKGLYDLNDVIYQAIAFKLGKFQAIVCDEVQDFSRAQLALALSMLQEDRRFAFLCAGDDKQTLTSSRFTWPGLKRYLQERLSAHPITHYTLTTNHRNPGPIAELSEQVIRLPQRFKIKSRTPAAVDAPIPGESATLVTSSSGSGQDLLDHAHAAEVIIVSDKQEEEVLKKRFNSMGMQPPLIILPVEAKGLEFKEVWAWHLIDRYADQWRRVMGKYAADNLEDIQFVQRQSRVLYVAFTRALYHLYIIEKDDSFFQENGLAPFESKDTGQLELCLEQRRKVLNDEDSSQQNWLKYAIYFLEEKRYERCIECLERIDAAGDDYEESAYLKRKAEGHILLRDGYFEAAGNRFCEIGDIENAVIAYDHGGCFSKVAQVLDAEAMRAGLTSLEGQQYREKRDHYKIRSLDRDGNYLASGRLSLRKGSFYEAAVRFMKAESDELLEEALLAGIKQGINYAPFLELAQSYFQSMQDAERLAQVLKLKVKGATS